jgi:hypothetical protein
VVKHCGEICVVVAVALAVMVVAVGVTVLGTCLSSECARLFICLFVCFCLFSWFVDRVAVVCGECRYFSGLSQGLDLTWSLFVFPYKHDAVVGGNQTVRDVIVSLLRRGNNT